MKRRPRTRKERVKRIIKIYKKRLVERATPAEIAFEHILVDYRIPYNFQYDTKVKYGRYKTFAIVDFYLPSVRCAVEIDGGYHNDPTQRHYDENRTAALTKSGMILDVIRFTNQEVLENPQEVAKSLVEQIRLATKRWIRLPSKAKDLLDDKSDITSEERKYLRMVA